MRNRGPFLTFIATGISLLFCQSVYAQRVSALAHHDFPWGAVSTANTPKGISVTINAPYRRQDAIVQSTATSQAAGETRMSVPPSFPSYEFYLAVPPGNDLRVASVSPQSIAVDPSEVRLVAGYRAVSDSTIIDQTTMPATQVTPRLSQALVSVAGYEWFRGYRLARIEIAPYQIHGSALTCAESIQTELAFVSSAAVGARFTKWSDPQFRPVLDQIVANRNDLSRLQQTQLSFQDTTGTWIPWGMPAVKLGIGEDAIYRLTYQDLQGLITNVASIDPATFRLYNKGKEIPIYVAGESDHAFNSNDYVEFPGTRNYGSSDYRSLPSGNQEYPEYLDRYTDTSFYWLTWGGAPGSRVDSNVFMTPSTDSLTWYTQLVHIEKNNGLQFADGNNLVVRQDPRWTSGDIWGWDWLYAGGVFNVPFTASNVYTSYPTARIYARCASVTWPLATPSYRVRLRLNSSDTLQYVDDIGATPQILIQGDAPIASLVNGTNTIRVYSRPTPSSVNAIWFDWAEAEYPRKLVVTGDTLVFGFPWITGDSVRTVVLTGLVSPDVAIYKYRPALKRILNVVIQGASPYTVSFVDTVAPGDQYMLSSVARIQKPSILGLRSFQNLRDPSRGADYILITADQFITTAQSYASMIGATDSLRTAVVNVSSIFDEFGYGYPTAEAIRNFLKATSYWQPPMPSFVFLVGNGTYDYKRFVTNPNIQYHPINVVPTYGEPVSDPWLAVLNDSSIVPQMYIGRLPANSPDEFDRYRQRVDSYIHARNDDWNKRYMFFAGGDPAVGGQIAQFRQTNESIIASMILRLATIVLFASLT